MSDLYTAKDTAKVDPQNVVQEPEQVIDAVTHPQVVITEQEVAFSTAAAASLPRARPTRGLMAAVRAMFRRTAEEAEGPALSDVPPRYYPPRRDAFLEHAAMQREMRRL